MIWNDIIKKHQLVIEFIRFCIVGVLCTGLDAAIFYTVGHIVCYQVALVSGYCISLVANYFFTIYWTFKIKPSKRNIVGIIVAHLFNLFVVRMGLMWLFIDLCGMTNNLAYVPTLVISVIVNFGLVKLAVKI